MLIDITHSQIVKLNTEFIMDHFNYHLFHKNGKMGKTQTFVKDRQMKIG